jgi:hypothetical protein
MGHPADTFSRQTPVSPTHLAEPSGDREWRLAHSRPVPDYCPCISLPRMRWNSANAVASAARASASLM